MSEPKYEYLIKKREDAGIKYLNNSNAFIECSNTMDDIYKLIAFDDMIVIKELFIRCRKLNTSLVFITQSYFSVLKDVILNTAYFFIMKIGDQIELQNIARNHSVDIDYKDFKKIYRECTKEPYNCFTIDTTLPASDPLRFRKKLFHSYKNDNN